MTKIRYYKITAKYINTTIEFSLPSGYRQDTLNDVIKSARKASLEAFGFDANNSLVDIQIIISEELDD